MPFPSPGDLPDPGIEPRSPALEADALTSEPPSGSPNLPDKEFQTMIVKMIQNLEIKMESQINSLETRIEKMQERFNKNLEEIKESQYIMNNAMKEIKNTLEGTNSRIKEAEDRISEVEDRNK